MAKLIGKECSPFVTKEFSFDPTLQLTAYGIELTSLINGGIRTLDKREYAATKLLPSMPCPSSSLKPSHQIISDCYTPLQSHRFIIVSIPTISPAMAMNLPRRRSPSLQPRGAFGIVFYVEILWYI
jgi:hypothetical protein